MHSATGSLEPTPVRALSFKCYEELGKGGRFSKAHVLASPELRTAQGLDFQHVLTGTKLSSPPLYHSEVSVWRLGPEGERVE